MAALPPIVPSAGDMSRQLPDDWGFAAFDHQPRTRLVFGPGVVSRVGEAAAETGARRVFLVTDPGIVKAGHADAVKGWLEDGGRAVEVFDRVRENPDTVCVAECVAEARVFRPDLLVGLGGGSAMDTAKGCNFLLTNGGRMEDYRGVGKARLPMLPFIAIPTTAGTGSECQSAALIADAATHMKMACLDPKATARVAILDPDLTLSQPTRVTACTGIDALAHALETAVCARRNAISTMYSREAFRLLVRSLPLVLRHPLDREGRGRMLLGAALAGTAIELSMLGAAHAAANPLTARYNVVHGTAVGLMLPHVIRFNARDARVGAAYAELVSEPGAVDSAEAQGQAVERLARQVERLLNVAGMPGSLAAAGVDPDAVPELAEQASRQWTANFNPRPVGPEDFVRLYRAAETERGSGVEE